MNIFSLFFRFQQILFYLIRGNCFYNLAEQDFFLKYFLKGDIFWNKYGLNYKSVYIQVYIFKGCSFTYTLWINLYANRYTVLYDKI